MRDKIKKTRAIVRKGIIYFLMAFAVWVFYKGEQAVIKNTADQFNVDTVTWRVRTEPKKGSVYSDDQYFHRRLGD